MNDFFATLYDGFHPLDLFYIQNFSDDMYESGIFSIIGLIMLSTSLVLIASYYYFISNYNGFFKKRYWFIWILVIGIVNFISAYFYSVTAMEDFYSTSSDGSPHSITDHINFSMVNLLWAIIFSFLFSMVLKFKSVCASKTPF